MKPIVIKPYNQAWADEFEILKAIFIEHLSEFDIQVEHVGSTSVPDLASKPILDIDIIMKDESQLNDIIGALEKLGYIHQGDLGIAGREAFKTTSDQVPYDNGRRYTFEQHLYLCYEGSLALENHLKFRDYLRAHPDAVNEYGRLKEQLAAEYADDVDTYCIHKTDFVTEILGRAGINQAGISEIAAQNL